MHIFGVVHQVGWFLWFSFHTCLAVKRSRCELVCFCLICYWIKFERRQSDRYSPLAVNYATDIHHIFNIEATVGKTACCGVGRVYIVNYLERKKLALGCIQAAMIIEHMGTWTWAGAWAHELSKLVKRLAGNFGASTWENMENWWYGDAISIYLMYIKVGHVYIPFYLILHDWRSLRCQSRNICFIL